MSSGVSQIDSKAITPPEQGVALRMGHGHHGMICGINRKLFLTGIYRPTIMVPRWEGK